MLGRGTVNIAEQSQQLEQIERQLKVVLLRAKEVASSSSFWAQEEQISDFDTNSKLKAPKFNPTINYCYEYWKAYNQNSTIYALIREFTDRKNQLNQLVTQIEVLLTRTKDLQDKHYRLNKLRNRKKKRRLAFQIQKSHLCPYDKCNRMYGSDTSLNFLIKLKHNGGNKTEREKLVKQICCAEEKNDNPPELTLNLPPGYLETYRRLYFHGQVVDLNCAMLSEHEQRILKNDDSQSESDF